jgi:chromosome segregation ATPase
MTESSEHFDRRLDQYMNMMVDLRVSQVVTDKQISQLGTKVDRIADAVDSLRETVVPIVLKQQEQLDKHQERLDKQQEQMEKHQAAMEKHQAAMEKHQVEIEGHTKNIEDLYRSQGHFLRRLFGEDLGTSE